jgi:tetratricopeptide (TPR) repeat protein
MRPRPHRKVEPGACALHRMRRRIWDMRLSGPIAAAVLLAWLSGCATTPEAQPEPPATRVEQLAKAREALLAQPDNAQLHLDYGDQLAALGNNAEALRAYERAVEKQPDYTPAFLKLAGALKKLGRHTAAIGAYETVLDHDPQNREALEGLMVCAEATGDVERLLEAAARFAELPPQTAESLAGYAALLLQFEYYEEAGDAYEQVIALDGAQAADHYNLGLCRYHTGDLDAAEAAWRQAVALHPQHAGANRGLAVIAYDRGDYDAAWEQVRVCTQKGIGMDAAFLKALEAAAPVFNAGLGNAQP